MAASIRVQSSRMAAARPSLAPRARVAPARSLPVMHFKSEAKKIAATDAAVIIAFYRAYKALMQGVTDGMGAHNDCNYESVLNLMTPEVVFKSNLHTPPFKGMYKGHTEIRELVDKVHDNFSVDKFIFDLTPLGPNVVKSNVKWIGTSRHTGVSIHTELQQIFKLNTDHMIIEIDERVDSDAFAHMLHHD